MTTGEAHPAAQMRAERLQFDGYVLDLRRGCLLLDGIEVVLRPKTFAVLRHLVANTGRLVSKDELFAAVWPNLTVTDDALVQSIGELRRALGDDGQRLIKTLPRRGYRFEAGVSVAAPLDSPVTTDVGADSAARPTTQPPRSSLPDQIWSLFATVLAGSRGRLLAGLALAALLAGGALWTNRGPPSSGALLNESGEVGKAAIAVLPFLNQSHDPAREYFANGVTQDIINALGRFSALTVMSWNAVLPYKRKPRSPGEIARDLAVRYQVEGSVRHTGERVRVIAQLVNMDGRVLWSGSFDETLADVFVLPDKITTQIASALAIRVTQLEERRVIAKPTESLEAYDYVLRARPALQRPARTSNVEARALLRKAIQLDRNYAAAYAALAETYLIDVSMGWAESPTLVLSHAEETASKALNLNNSEVRARVILGRIHIFYQRYEQAKAEIDRAIATNPNDAHAIAGRGNILMWSGQTDAAIEALELAQRIDPELNSMDTFALSLAYYVKGRYDAAIEQAKLNIRKTEGADFSQVLLAAAYAQQNRSEDAARVVTIIRRMYPTFDPQTFGSKFLNPAHLEHLRDGFRKAGLYPAEASQPSTGR